MGRALWSLLPVTAAAMVTWAAVYVTVGEVFPHPIYASHGWVSVINPHATSATVREQLLHAYDRAKPASRE